MKVSLSTACRIAAHRGADYGRGRDCFIDTVINTVLVVVADITIDDRQSADGPIKMELKLEIPPMLLLTTLSLRSAAPINSSRPALWDQGDDILLNS